MMRRASMSTEARARLRERDNAKKRALRKTVNGIGKHEVRRPNEEQFQIARRLIPPDTRDLTGRLMGDPLSGRSALDMRGKP